MLGRFYVVVVQAVILFWSKTWFLTPQLDKYLKGFHHLLARQMLVMVPKLQQDRTCVYSPIGSALAMVRLDEIGVYIDQRLNMVAQYIVTRPIMDLCLAAERNPGMRLSK